MKNNQTDKHADAQLIDSLARWIVYLVIAGVAAFTLLASTLAFGLLSLLCVRGFQSGRQLQGGLLGVYKRSLNFPPLPQPSSLAVH